MLHPEMDVTRIRHVMREALENLAVAMRREENALGIEMSQLRFRFAAFLLP